MKIVDRNLAHIKKRSLMAYPCQMSLPQMQSKMNQFILTFVCALSFIQVEAVRYGHDIGIRPATISYKSSSRISSPIMGPLMMHTNGMNYGKQQQIASGGIIPIAIQTRHKVEYKEIPSTGKIQAATVEVGARSIPINVIFRSASSLLNVLQQHQGAAGDTQESSSEDEPHRLVHTVTKPIIQEIHEVISPFRKITQEVHPVQEEIQTIVARNTQQQQEQQQQKQQQQQQQQKQQDLSAPVILEPITINDDSLSKVLGSGISSSASLLGNDIDGKSIAAGLDQSLSKSVALVLGSSSNKVSNTKSY